MRIEFPHAGYEAIAGADIPDENLLGVFSPQAFPSANEGEILRQAFENPIGAARLSDEVKENERVLILIDDGTRRTPIARILPFVIDELHRAGVGDGQIELLQAPGTHRPMNERELREKLGECFGRYPVHEHHWLDDASLAEIGHTRDGTKVTVNRRVVEADFVLGIGGIVPHRVKGFSGGAKIVFPGVAGREIMERNQWEASMHMSVTVMGVAENPMRLRMEEAARLAGLRYLVNVVFDAEDRIVGCWVGDFVRAHREGCRTAKAVYEVHLPTRADIVIADSHPADRDFWQSAKGAYSGTLAVKDGGTLILVSPNPEGVASNHEILLRLGYRPHAELVKLVHQGKVDDLVGAAILGDVCQIVDRAHCVMVSPGVKPEEAERIGFRAARDLEEAIAMAFERQGPNAKVAVLRSGGHILPVIDDESEELSR